MLLHACSSSADQDSPALSPHSERARSFYSVNKQQPGNWDAASLGVWWNKCILICTDLAKKSRSTAKPHIRTLRGDFFFLLSFSFLSWDRLTFLLSAGRLLVVVSLHSTTLQNTPSRGSIQQLSRLLLSVSPTGRALLYKVLKAHKFCKFNKSTFWVWYLAVCVANIFRAPYQGGSSMDPNA